MLSALLISQWKKPLTLYGDPLQRKWNMNHTQNCSLHWIFKIVCCSLAAGSEIFIPTPYFIFLGFLSLTTKSVAVKIQYSLWKDSWVLLLQLYCVLWLLWRCCKRRNGDNIWKTTKTKSKVAIWNERVLDSFPNCFQCFHLPSIVSHCSADVLFFRIKRMISILFHGKYFVCVRGRRNSLALQGFLLQHCKARDVENTVPMDYLIVEVHLCL